MRTVLLLSIIFFLPTTALAFDTVDWEYSQDFENGELNAWSSYPPIQDTAYEAPYIYPGRALPDDSSASLCKILYPSSENAQLSGVVKQFAMTLDEKSSRIRFRYCVKATVSPVWLGIDLACADGGRIKARFPAPEINRWQSADYSLDDILRAAGMSTRSGSRQISAMAVYARFERCDPDMPILFAIDDVSVTGKKNASIDILEPETAALDEWESEITLRHYRNGEPLTLRLADGNEPYDSVRAEIRRFDRPDERVGEYKLRKKDNAWTLAKRLVLDNKSFPAGMYSVSLEAKRSKTVVVRTDFTFMVIDDALIARHPRFWFSADTVDEYKKRLETKYPAFLAYIRHEAEDARANLSNELPDDLRYFPKVGWLKSFEAYRTRIATIPTRAFANALVYALDDDREAAQWAKDTLVNLCRWKSWNHPWMQNRGHHIYLYVSYVTRELAMTYDIVYELLTEEERRIVSEAFVNNGLIPAYKTYVVADMVTNDESNWITAIVGGSLLAGCSIIGDIEDSSALEPYLSGCIYKLNAHMNIVYGGDSGCIEGFSYGYGTMRHYSEILPLYKRTLGLDFAPMFAEDYSEALWAGDHYKGMYFSFGDAHWTGGNSFSSFPWLIEHFRDPELAWLYDRNRATPAAHTLQVPNFIIDDVEAVKPTLHGAKLFETTGTAVFRSGNEPDSFIFTFRCGPFGNHQHLDQGSFFLHDRGETLLTELGYSNYYDDPFYQSHVTQPVGHNCILVDGNIHSQRVGDHAAYAAGMKEHASIAAFVGGESIGYVSGDLGPLYTGNVKSLKRDIVWFAPRTILMFDRLETIDGEAEMNALFHGPRYSDINFGGGTFEIMSGDVSLHGFPIGDDHEVSLEPEIVTLANYTNDPIQPLGRLTLTKKTQDGKALNAVLMSTDLALNKTVENNRTGMLYTEMRDAIFLMNPAHEMLTYGPFTTDGLFTAVTSANGAFLVVDGTTGSLNGFHVLQADSPATMLYEGDTVHYDTDKETRIHVEVDNPVRTVILNGSKVKGWKRDRKAGIVSVTVPKGRGSFRMLP